MALNQQFLQLMVWLKEKGYLAETRNVVEIGAQQLNDGFLLATTDIARLSKLFGVPAPDLPLPLAASPRRQLDPAAPHARNFYAALGLEYSCVDIDSTPGAIPLDLNFDSVPAHLAGHFHLVTNFGTTEHIPNQLNAFKIIHDLAGPGAIMIHELPAQGEINHGLISYQPKFFELLARANGYEILFFDFSWSAAEHGLPGPLEKLIGRFVDTRKRPEYVASAAALAVVLRKTSVVPFVPPADVPYGSKAPNRQIENRYGPVFRRSGGFPAIIPLMREWLRHKRDWIRRRVGRT